MMPQSPKEFHGLTLKHRIQPSMILSGDFIDYFELQDGRFLFYIADVSGHGSAAALITIILKSLSVRLLNESHSSHDQEGLSLVTSNEILGWFNSELLRLGVEQHVTMFLGLMNASCSELQYSNAGHFPGAIVADAEQVRYLEIGGLPLGIKRDVTYGRNTVVLPNTFVMVMFSDGVLEILSETTLKDKEKALLSLVNYGVSDTDSIAEQLNLKSITNVSDDVAVFSIVR
jgi:serine phosphatase RsbU (regulator of sigma subunit)